ncbi:MAG: SDR family oxidoreductase [Beutenbergiaceae bacterium]
MSSAHPFDLTGRTALVTGASRGIGLAMAHGLAAAGADIVAVSATLPERGSKAQEVIESTGRGFTGYRVDFSDREAIAEFAEQVVAQHPGIDILVNNAGTIRRSPAAQHPLTDWDEVLAINLSSQFILTQRIGADMVERGGGSVIFTASLLSFQGGINVPGYSASKHGIAGLTKALANEWAAHGVRVNAIAPGYIATDNTQALREDPERSAAILDRIPARRWGQAQDLAGAAVFLASDAAAYVSGVILPVDGGWMAR